jgi:hypothetical protein
MKHKHSELIKKWADGAKIQIKFENDNWEDVDPTWIEEFEYRIKPEEKNDFAVSANVIFKLGLNGDYLEFSKTGKHNIEFLFDGDTHKLKALRRLKND